MTVTMVSGVGHIDTTARIGEFASNFSYCTTEFDVIANKNLTVTTTEIQLNQFELDTVDTVIESKKRGRPPLKPEVIEQRASEKRASQEKTSLETSEKTKELIILNFKLPQVIIFIYVLTIYLIYSCEVHIQLSS